MEMKLKPSLIKTEREKRAWSQEHLASVAGLGVRTVQRMESTNSASLESVKAISSVFELPIDQMRLHEKLLVNRQKSIARRLGLGTFCLSVFVIVISQFLTNPIFASDVLLQYKVSLEKSVAGTTFDQIGLLENRSFVKKGETASIEMPDRIKIEITPLLPKSSDDFLKPGEMLLDGEILLAVKIYVKNGEAFKLVAQPRIVTTNKTEGMIQMEDDNGQLIKISLIPTVNQL